MWYVGIIHDYVLCTTDRNKSDDAIPSMGETKAVHDLISYRGNTFVFLLLVYNHEGWMKWMVSINSQADPIHKGCIERWTQN